MKLRITHHSGFYKKGNRESSSNDQKEKDTRYQELVSWGMTDEKRKLAQIEEEKR